MSRQEAEALVERMLALQLKDMEQMADYDENGLETIDLSEEVTTTSKAKG